MTESTIQDRFNREGFDLVLVTTSTVKHRHYPHGVVYSINGEFARMSTDRRDSVKSFPDSWDIYEYKPS